MAYQYQPIPELRIYEDTSENRQGSKFIGALWIKVNVINRETKELIKTRSRLHQFGFEGETREEVTEKAKAHWEACQAKNAALHGAKLEAQQKAYWTRVQKKHETEIELEA